MDRRLYTLVLMFIPVAVGPLVFAQQSDARASGRLPGGYHTVSAVAGAAFGYAALTPQSGGWTFTISADNFLDNRPVDLWIVRRPFPKEEEFELARYGFKVQSFRTNKDGELRNVLIDRPVVVGDTLVLNYMGDGKYVPQFDAKLDTWEWAKQAAVKPRDTRPVALTFGR